MINPAGIVVFSLSGFNATVNYRATLFSLTLLSYFAILLVNVSLIVIIALDQNLHEPMYICLCTLCLNGIYGTTCFYPKFAYDLLADIQVISYAGCLLQIFAVYSFVKIDLSILALMAYDRYVAICLPLKYHYYMSVRRTALLVCVAWLIPISCDIMIVAMASTMRLCGSHISKLYCENWAIVKLACGSISSNDIVGLIVIAVYCGHIVFIVNSYVQVVRSTFKSKESMRKFTQTCVPHLMCLFNVTAALLFDVMYSRYGSSSLQQSLKNFMALQFLMIPPLLNPIIYGLILTKVRKRVISVCMTAGQRLKLRLKV
ncbi:olfactory receptor 1500-like [Pleuronectes platessa]|uniref:olfactory receptor 1500-like n=1 Tax=Pleuronectes platessa TaxID=8262 RepID=UPI00232A5933|nr:olfactory receptor 1500-like [Pleuronectes platessa]